ncbi:hypothetical protein BDW60DRAFT_182057 [Aspergillus nidulans var. acristatus]
MPTVTRYESWTGPSVGPGVCSLHPLITAISTKCGGIQTSPSCILKRLLLVTCQVLVLEVRSTCGSRFTAGSYVH